MMSESSRTSCSVMILTGGKSTRFGTDKSRALLGSSSLIDHLLDSLPQELDVILVGPTMQVDRPNVQFVIESPVGAGPVAAIAAGLSLVESEFVVILATDMPFASRIVVDLIERTAASELIPDGLIPLDSQNFRQPLCALYRPDSMRRALRAMGTVADESMRRFTALLEIQEIKIPASLEGNLLDIDTQEDLSRAITFSERALSEQAFGEKIDPDKR